VNARKLHATYKAFQMPHPNVVINQAFAAFTGKSRATFTRRVQALQPFVSLKEELHVFATATGNGGWDAHLIAMKLDHMVCLGILLAVLFVGIVGAFLFYVQTLTVIAVVTLVLGLALMFALGMLTGRRVRKISPFTHRAMPMIR
jgi:hypothetical protein